MTDSNDLVRECDLRIEGPALLPQGLVDPAVVLVDGQEITWSGPREDAPSMEAGRTLRYEEDIIIPGFVDLHIHGAAGADAADGSRESLEIISRAHVRHGTTTLCPTVLTSPPEVTLRALEAIRAAAARGPAGARIVGAHLEGPFLNPRRAGAQPTEHMLPPDPVLLGELIAAGGEALKIMTLAPELPGALDLVATLKEHGVRAAMGHSDASYAEARAAAEAGVILATHTFNGMRGLHHREPGILGAVLEDDTMIAEVIADGVHICPPVLGLLWKLKCNDQLALVTDCLAALEAPGQARLGDRVVVVEDGEVRLPDGTLAGSILTMERAVMNLIQYGGATIRQAVSAATRVPAEVLGLKDRGSLTRGRLADLLVVDHELKVKAVVVGGEEVDLERRPGTAPGA